MGVASAFQNAPLPPERPVGIGQPQLGPQDLASLAQLILGQNMNAEPANAGAIPSMRSVMGRPDDQFRYSGSTNIPESIRAVAYPWGELADIPQQNADPVGYLSYILRSTQNAKDNGDPQSNSYMAPYGRGPTVTAAENGRMVGWGSRNRDIGYGR